jgi:hypothetical protein
MLPRGSVDLAVDVLLWTLIYLDVYQKDVEHNPGTVCSCFGYEQYGVWCFWAAFLLALDMLFGGCRWLNVWPSRWRCIRSFQS